MSKTCKDCLHCSIEGAGEVYCSGMPWHYPFGGSDTTALDKEACEHFLERDKPTVFDRITASPEVLAEKLVYCVKFVTVGGKGFDRWYSTLLPFDKDIYFYSREKAIAVTVEKLKEVCDEFRKEEKKV